MSTTSKLIVSGILAILIVALGTTSIIQANAQTPTKEQIEKCKEIKASSGFSLLHPPAEWKDSGCNFIEEVH